MQKEENSKCVVVFLSVSGETLLSQRCIASKGKKSNIFFRLFDRRLFGKSSSFRWFSSFLLFRCFSSFLSFFFCFCFFRLFLGFRLFRVFVFFLSRHFLGQH